MKITFCVLRKEFNGAEVAVFGKTKMLHLHGNPFKNSSLNVGNCF